jgi:hypothetical protein
MTTTIEAMKQALKALHPFEKDANGIHQDWADNRRRASLAQEVQPTVGDYRRVAAAASSLREAISAEEVQMGEAVVWTDSLDCVSVRVRRSDDRAASGDGVKAFFKIPLFTRPAQPAINKFLAGKLELMTTERDKLLLELGDLRALRAVRPTNCGSGHCSCVECVMPTDQQKLMSITGTGEPGSRGRMRAPTASCLTLEGDRAALIEKLRWAAKVGGDAILHVGGVDTHKKAADMLAADAVRADKRVDSIAADRDYWREQAQQVAVPQGWKPAPIEPTPAMCAAGFVVSEAEHDPAGVYRAMLAAVPQPPQADALAADHMEDVRAMVPMTSQELDDLLPTNDSMSRKDSQRWIARATERHHGIGGK